MKKKRQSPNQASKLDPIHPNAAGIDIGAQNHWVCVPSGRTNECVRRFGCYTADLYAIADWLTESGVETVAMESTGVYWIPLFQILETRGFEVKLVNAHHVKTLPGRKTDVLDCQWLQQLHSYGLLSGSFRPEDEICILRSYIRQRDSLIRSASVHIQRMQKYRSGGLSGLLEIKKAAGAKRKINDAAIAALKGELETGKGFSSYGAIVEWLKQEHGLHIEYGTVYAWVRYRFGAKLKVPRPQSYKQDEELISEFKKNSVPFY